MDEDFVWRLILRSAPDKVFSALIRAAGAAGRVCGVDNYGTVLTYLPCRRPGDPAGRVRIRVEACPEGSIVTVEAVDPGLSTTRSVAVHAESVATLMSQLGRQYREGSAPEHRPSAD